MIRCVKNKRLLAGLCCLTATLIGLRGAEAGSTSSITITGGYKPGGGDPPYDYIFNVYLNAPTTAGTNTFGFGDSFTIESLPGVDTSSLSSEPSNFPDVIWAPKASNEVLTPGGSAPYESDFTWTFGGTTTYTATTPVGGPVGPSVSLGQFTVESSFQNFTSVPLPPGTQVTYTYTGAPVGVTLTFPIQDLSVPEPSSAILLFVGAGGMMPMVWLIKRRRRQLPQPLCSN